MVVFQFAGIDTSKMTSNGCIILLSKLREQQDKFYLIAERWLPREMGSEIDIDKFDNDEELDMYIKEMLRMHSSVSVLVQRQFIKPTKIGKVTFRAGDGVMIPSQLMQMFSKKWETPEVFDLTRFKISVNIDKAAYLPFGIGRRICIGKSLAEFATKIVLTNFYKYFESYIDGEYEEEKLMAVTYGYVDPTVIVSRRLAVINKE